MQKRRPTKIEIAKAKSRGLRGAIEEELAQPSDHFESDTTQILKFHGVYQQDDRDLRKSRRLQGQGKAWQFMVRTKTPGGGKLSARQWLVLDGLAEEFGNGTLRITTRQDLQFHGVGKARLKATIQRLNAELVTTYGACGDGVRNVLACPVSSIDAGARFDGLQWARRISRHLGFRSTAYYEVWLDGEKIEPVEEEPLYGKSYLPRKFKIAVAAPDHNCVDVFTNDVGIIPLTNAERPAGFHVVAGGGMGSTHGREETFPRLASPLASASPDELLDLLTAIVAAQRDMGDRTNRKHARLKYLIEDMGMEAFRVEVQGRFGRSLKAPGRLPVFSGADDHLGWSPQKQTDLRSFGLFVENGRIADAGGVRLKTALRAVISRHRLSVLLTPGQNLILGDVPVENAGEVESALREFGVVGRVSKLRLKSLACPALPTCGLAITEAERFMPHLISELERLGCGGEDVVMRMSGCPNSCSRPPVAEIGLVGKSVGAYNVYLGGNQTGTRLARLYASDVPGGALAQLISQLIEVFRAYRREGEKFGDFACRLGFNRLGELARELPNRPVNSAVFRKAAAS